jgi:predicted RNase H-like nuclease (RuvC/YqgF family)
MNLPVMRNITLNDKIKNAINIGYTIVSWSEKMRKKRDAFTIDNASLKKSLKELDKMSVELVDRLLEINASITTLDRTNNETKPTSSRLYNWLEKNVSKSRKRIEIMKLTYKDIYSL